MSSLILTLSVVTITCSNAHFSILVTFFFGPLSRSTKFLRNVKSGGRGKREERKGQKEAVKSGKVEDEN